MKVSEEDREAEINGLNLPSNLLKIALAREVPKLLKDHCRKVKYYYEPDIRLPEFEFVPLWEGHSSITGFRYQGDSIQYFKFHIETPEAIKDLGTSIHGVISDIFAWLWTEEEVEDEIILELGRYLEFPQTKEFLEEIEIANTDMNEPQPDWEKRFRLSL